MKKYLQINIFALVLTIITTLFGLFIYHNFFSGGDELRTTYVSKQIADQGSVFFKDENNEIYHTNIFVKSGFFINGNNLIYPVGFLINSLLLIPILALHADPILTFNLFAYLNYLVSFILIYKIFIKLKLNQKTSIVGASVYIFSNFYLALFVSYYPDFTLITFTLLFIYLLILYHYSPKIPVVLLLFITASFITAYKITMFPAIAVF
jgi:hypothetical protein